MMLIVFDSNYVAWVCAHAISTGMMYRGGRTEVIFGFLRQIISILEGLPVTQVAFCWDTKNSKRKEIYEGYKGKRHDKRRALTPEEEAALALVFDQFEEIKEVVLRDLGFTNVFCAEGYESDDLIAKIVMAYTEGAFETMVISSDQDLYQLLDYCVIYSITKKQSMDKEIFTREFKIQPALWSEVKAISGCSTDNVPGVKGIGEKKAISFLLGDLKGKGQAAIIESSEIIERNRTLVKLPFEGTPLPRLRPNALTIERFVAVCLAYGLESLQNDKTYFRWENIIKKIS